MPMVKPVYPQLNKSHPLANGLVGCWAMTGNGGSTVRDLTGYGNHGALSDTSYLTWAGSPYGTALRHTAAANIMLTAADSNSLDITGEFTLMSLVNYEVDTFNWLPIITKIGSVTNTTPYEFYRDRAADRLGLRVMAQGLASNSATSTIAINQWYHVAVVFDGAKLATFYVDGKPCGTAGPYNVFPSASALALNIGTGWQGSMAGAWIYDRALSPDEIAYHAFDPFAMARPRQRIWKPAAAAAGMFLPQLLQSGEYGGY